MIKWVGVWLEKTRRAASRRATERDLGDFAKMVEGRGEAELAESLQNVAVLWRSGQERALNVVLGQLVRDVLFANAFTAPRPRPESAQASERANGPGGTS